MVRQESQFKDKKRDAKQALKASSRLEQDAAKTNTQQIGSLISG